MNHLGSIHSLRTLPLDRALEHTGVGLAACDADGRLTLLSPELQRILGHGFEPLAEASFTCVFDLTDESGTEPLPVERIPLVRARGGEFVRDEMLHARRPDGRVVHLRCNASPLEEDGELSGAVVLVQDVTAEYEAHREAAELRRATLERVQHEIRTPLSALLGHLELMEDLDADLPFRLDISMQAMSRAGRRLRDLLAELDESVSV